MQFFNIDDDIITSDNILSNQQIQTTAKSVAADHIVASIFDFTILANGLKLDRFTPKDIIPSRQDITQQIAAWFKYIGLDKQN